MHGLVCELAIPDEFLDVKIPLTDEVIRGKQVSIPSLEFKLKLTNNRCGHIHQDTVVETGLSILVPIVSISLSLSVFPNLGLDKDIRGTLPVFHGDVLALKDTESDFKLLLGLVTNVPDSAGILSLGDWIDVNPALNDTLSE